MFGFKEIAAVASAVGLLSFQPSSTPVWVDPHELEAADAAFASTFKGVDADGQTLVWSSDSPASGAGFILRIMPMGSALSSAESVWAVSATLTERDGAGIAMESKLYGIIDWSKQELKLHGECESGAKTGNSVTALGKFTDFDINGTVAVLPLTRACSRR